MKKMIKVAFVAAIAMVAGYNMYQSQSVMNGMSEFALANVEALASGESSGGYGCGYAVYEWDNDWYEDSKSFTRCVSGCPTGSGTEPKYVQCN